MKPLRTSLRTSLASLALIASTCSVFMQPAAALDLAPSAVANASQNIGYFFGGLGTDLTINWSEGNPNVGLLQFNVSALASGSVLNATLDLYHHLNGVGSAQFGIFRNTSAWVGVTTDYNSRPSTDLTPMAVLSINDNLAGLHRTVDVTALVQGWVNGDYANYGLTLSRLDNTNPYVYFSASAPASAPDGAPRLIINAVPEPDTIVMLCAGLAVLGVAIRRRAHSA